MEHSDEDNSEEEEKNDSESTDSDDDKSEADEEAIVAEAEEIEKLLANCEIEDNEFMADKFDEERDRADGVNAEIMGEGTFTDDQLNEFRQLYLDVGEGELVHKRTLIKRINQSRAVSKSCIIDSKVDHIHR